MARVPSGDWNQGLTMDGFRATISGGRLIIGDPWYTHAIDSLILAFTLSTAFALVAIALEGADFSPLPLLLCGAFLTVTLYLLESGRQKKFVFDNDSHELLAGRKRLCETDGLAAIEVECCEAESVCCRVQARGADGKHYVLGEYASESAALRLATRIGEYTGLPVRTEHV